MTWRTLCLSFTTFDWAKSDRVSSLARYSTYLANPLLTTEVSMRRMRRTSTSTSTSTRTRNRHGPIIHHRKQMSPSHLSFLLLNYQRMGDPQLTGIELAMGWWVIGIPARQPGLNQPCWVHRLEWGCIVSTSISCNVCTGHSVHVGVRNVDGDVGCCVHDGCFCVIDGYASA